MEKEAQPSLKPTTAIDFFGSTPVTQKTKPSILTKAKVRYAKLLSFSQVTHFNHHFLSLKMLEIDHL